ncbi:MAG: eIF2B alpha/beta/delta subunit family protein [Dehalococcoidia bacterium]
MKAAIRKAVNTIGRDRENGAGWLTSQSLEALKAACLESDARTATKFLSQVGEVVDALIQLRPGMVSIANYALKFRDDLSASQSRVKTIESLKKQGVAIARRLIRYREKSTISAARHATNLVGRRTIILTCSYSSSVCDALELAKRKGLDFKVLAAESLHGKVSYGRITAGRLEKAGIVCRIVPDSQVHWHVARADTVLIGADSVSLQGWLINGFPTLEVAEIAGRRGMPVYAICEKAKFDVRGFITGMRRPEPGFDMVPLELVTSFITESGLLTPDDIYNFSFEDIFGGRLAGSG